MPEPLAHLYDLALRALDEQERRAEALRSRVGPLLAAAALGVSLLSGPLLADGRPTSTIGRLAVAMAVGGVGIALAAAAALLRSRRHVSSETDARRLAGVLDHEGALDDGAAFYRAMLLRLDQRRRANAVGLDRLGATFTAMLCGILVMLCGLAAATLVG